MERGEGWREERDGESRGMERGVGREMRRKWERESVML